MREIESIKEQLISEFKPSQILLFGSRAKGTATATSDIDLCVVADTANKRHTLTQMYLNIETERPVDFVLYTPDEWRICLADKQSFAHKISCEGVCLYGG